MRRIAKRFSALLIMVCMIVIMMPALGDSGVAHAASKIRLNKTTVYIAKGSSVKLKVLGTKARVKWKSSKKSIAKVTKKGKITGKKIGSCTVTAKVKGRKLKCKVVVETKERNQARKLRTYILSKGKYDPYRKDYYITRSFYKEEGEVETTIRANKRNNQMTFDWRYDVGTPAETLKSKLVINLIKKDPVKKGKLYQCWDDGYGELDDSIEWTGFASNAFDGKSAGLTLSAVKHIWDVSTENEETGEEEIVTRVSYEKDLSTWKSTAVKRLRESFIDMSPLLKKAGVTYRSIGFSKLK